VTVPAISVKNFSKTFRGAIGKRPSTAVVDVTFDVMQGEIFGFLGPNGAGKTTTIKALLGLIRGDTGTLSILGHPADSLGWRAQVGYLPEHPNFYDFLTAFELVTWFGRLSGLTKVDAEREATRQLERVKLGHAMHRRLRSYSKGMLQRAGLAQALVAAPKLLILDEPMTGLDPIGRRDVRELLLELRAEGRTIFYSTHILPDVEMTCDRVAIVHQGKLHRLGKLEDILGETTRSVTVKLSGLSAERLAAIRSAHPSAKTGEDWAEVDFADPAQGRSFAAEHVVGGAVLEALETNREDLETIFLRTLVQSGATNEGLRS
jgi:ABC-2 type transport system ATP-binding protein